MSELEDQLKQQIRLLQIENASLKSTNLEAAARWGQVTVQLMALDVHLKSCPFIATLSTGRRELPRLLGPGRVDREGPARSERTARTVRESRSSRRAGAERRLGKRRKVVAILSGSLFQSLKEPAFRPVTLDRFMDPVPDFRRDLRKKVVESLHG